MGSNPTLSAIFLFMAPRRGSFVPVGRGHFSTVSFPSFFLTRKSRKQLLHLYGDMMLKYIFLPGGDLRGTVRICFLQNGHRRSTLLNIPKISIDAKSHNHPSSLFFGPKTGKTIKTQTNIDTINHQYFFLILRNRRSQSSLSTEVFPLGHQTSLSPSQLLLQSFPGRTESPPAQTTPLRQQYLKLDQMESIQ